MRCIHTAKTLQRPGLERGWLYWVMPELGRAKNTPTPFFLFFSSFFFFFLNQHTPFQGAPISWFNFLVELEPLRCHLWPNHQHHEHPGLPWCGVPVDQQSEIKPPPVWTMQHLRITWDTESAFDGYPSPVKITDSQCHHHMLWADTVNIVLWSHSRLNL